MSRHYTDAIPFSCTEFLVCHPDTSTGNNSQYEWNSYVSR